MYHSLAIIYLILSVEVKLIRDLQKTKWRRGRLSREYFDFPVAVIIPPMHAILACHYGLIQRGYLRLQYQGTLLIPFLQRRRMFYVFWYVASGTGFSIYRGAVSSLPHISISMSRTCSIVGTFQFPPYSNIKKGKLQTKNHPCD